MDQSPSCDERKSGETLSDKTQSSSSGSSSISDLPLQENEKGHDPTNAPEVASSIKSVLYQDLENASDSTSIPDEDKGGLDDKPKSLIAVIMIALSLAVFLSALDITIVTVALPQIAAHFNNPASYTWVGSAFLLANAASTPLWGKLADILGRKPMLLLANGFFMVGSLICALSVNIGMLLAGRAIQGIASGGLLTLVHTIIGDLFSLRTRGTYLGVVGATWALASALGPVVGGAFTTGITWRWCFYINLPLDGISFTVILFFLKLNTPKTPLIEGIKAIDWLGTFAIVAGTLLLLFGLQYGGNSFPWDSATVLCLLIVGVVMLAVFFFIEWKFARYPIIPLRLFAHRSNIGALLVVFFHSYVYISAFYFIPLYFQAIRGATPLLAGVYTLPAVLATGLSAAVSGAFMGATGEYILPIYTGILCMTLGYGLFIDLDFHSSWAKIVVYQILAGMGNGPNFEAPLVALSAHIKQHDIATGTATLNFIRNLSTSISLIAGQALYTNQLAMHQAKLQSEIGPQAIAIVNGAGASSMLIDQLPEAERLLARTAFVGALSKMWIMYTAFAAAGLPCILLIRRKVLTKEHQQTEVGLEAERKAEAERRAERDSRNSEKK